MKKTTFILSIAFIITGALFVFTNHQKIKLFADDVVTRETTKYYEVDSKSNKDKVEISSLDFEIKTNIVKEKQISKASKRVEEATKSRKYKESNTRGPVEPPLFLLPEIYLSGVTNGGSTYGTVTVTYNLNATQNAYAMYSVNNGSYVSFDSGKLFDREGSYTIYAHNSEGNVYKSFTILANNTSASPEQIPNSYLSVVTTLTYQKANNYVALKTTATWIQPPYNDFRDKNFLSIGVREEDFRFLDNVNFQTKFSYDLRYDEYIYDSNLELEETNLNQTEACTWVLNMNQPNPEAATDRFQYNNGTRVIICLSKNYPMAKDVDVTGSDATFGRYIKEYTYAKYELSGHYILNNASSTIGTYNFINSAYDSNGNYHTGIEFLSDYVYGKVSCNSNYVAIGCSSALFVLSVVFIYVPVAGVALAGISYMLSIATSIDDSTPSNPSNDDECIFASLALIEGVR